MKVSEFLLLFIKGILLLALGILLTNFNWVIQFILIGFLFFFSSLWMTNGNKGIKLLIAALILYIPFFLMYGISSIKGASYQTFPIWGIALISVLISPLIKNASGNKLFLWIYPVFITAIGFLGMPNYLNFIIQTSSFSKERLPLISFVSEDNNEISFQNMKGKIIVLDFWASNCIPCFKKFPELERIYMEYKSSDDVIVYSVNLPQPNENREYAKKLIGKYNYSFPKIYASDEKTWKQLNIEAVPTLLIIDRDLNIRYRGGLNAEWYHFYNNTNQIIEDLRNE